MSTATPSTRPGPGGALPCCAARNGATSVTVPASAHARPTDADHRMREDDTAIAARELWRATRGLVLQRADAHRPARSRAAVLLHGGHDRVRLVDGTRPED